MATDEVVRLQRQLAEGAQSAFVQDSDELQSLRRTAEELSVALLGGKGRATVVEDLAGV